MRRNVSRKIPIYDLKVNWFSNKKVGKINLFSQKILCKCVNSKSIIIKWILHNNQEYVLILLFYFLLGQTLISLDLEITGYLESHKLYFEVHEPSMFER